MMKDNTISIWLLLNSTTRKFYACCLIISMMAIFVRPACCILYVLSESNYWRIMKRKLSIARRLFRHCRLCELQKSLYSKHWECHRTRWRWKWEKKASSVLIFFDQLPLPRRLSTFFFCIRECILIKYRSEITNTKLHMVIAYAFKLTPRQSIHRVDVRFDAV